MGYISKKVAAYGQFVLVLYCKLGASVSFMSVYIAKRLLIFKSSFIYICISFLQEVTVKKQQKENEWKSKRRQLHQKRVKAHLFSKTKKKILSILFISCFAQVHCTFTTYIQMDQTFCTYIT